MSLRVFDTTGLLLRLRMVDGNWNKDIFKKVSNLKIKHFKFIKLFYITFLKDKLFLKFITFLLRHQIFKAHNFHFILSFINTSRKRILKFYSNFR